MKKINILLTSVGRRSYLVQYFKDVLKENGTVHVANSSDISPAFQIADKAVVTPLIYDKEYVPFLREYCLKNNITAIISLFDIDLPILAAHKEEFREIGVTALVSDPDVIEVCNDKWKTYQFLINNGFNAPKTYLSVDDTLKSIEEGIISYPLMVKPRWGMGSIAVYEAETEEELRVFFSKVQRNIKNTYLKYESDQDLENCVLIQEKLKGQEYGLDIINDLEGDYQTTIVKMKYAMRSGETDCAVTMDKLEIKRLGEALSKSLRHIANLDVDVFEVDGKSYVLEMNARFGGGYPFSHMAGVNLPLAIVTWLRGEREVQVYLTERINVMSQKDIGLVRLYLKPEYEIQKISNIDKVHELVKKFEAMLVPSLTARKVDIYEYAKKIGGCGCLLAAEQKNGKCLGILAAYMNSSETKEAYLTMIAIDKACRGLKIGERLMIEAQKMAKTAGMQTFKLEVRKQNYTAIGFYEYLGFCIQEVASEDSYYMIKSLDSTEK